MIDYSIKSKEYYAKLKRKFNRKYNLIYKTNYSPRPIIGECSYLYKKYNPSSYEDFFAKYTNDFNDNYSFETHKGDYRCGRSIEQLTNLAECYFNDIKKKEPKSKVTVQECFDDLVNHIIIETFDGRYIERFFVDMIRQSSDDFIVEQCTGDLDTLIGIDILVKKRSDKNYVRYLQIKPHTFFANTYNKSLINDRKNTFHKENLLREKIDRNGLMEFIIYNRDSYYKDNEILIATKGKKTKFKLLDIIDENGYPKFDIIKDFTYEIPGQQKKNFKQDK